MLNNPIIRYGGTLLIITLVVGGLLAVANMLTKEQIRMQELHAQIEARERMLQGLDYDQEIEPTDENLKIWQYTREGVVVAYAALSSAQGYGGLIDIIVGVDANMSILGVDIVSHSETPGLGSKATDDDFKSQYIGKIFPISVKKGSNVKENEVSAISGATITTNAITAAVNQAIEQVNNLRSVSVYEEPISID